jgi:hypothetical protein
MAYNWHASYDDRQTLLSCVVEAQLFFFIELMPAFAPPSPLPAAPGVLS